MEPKGLMVIKDPEVAKLLSDELRRNILHLVTHKEMSAADLVNELDKNYSSIMYHLRLLKEAGLIKQVREEIVQNKIQPYYRATAWSFHVSYYLDETMINDEEYQAWQEDLMNRLMKGLEAYGLSVPEDKASRVKELLKTLYLQQKKEFEERREMRMLKTQLEPHIGKSISHILSNIRLTHNEKYREATMELSDILEL
jgi:DNA-binding transcriptional ArsR family regulator